LNSSLGLPGGETVEDLGVKIYKELFSPFYDPENLFDDPISLLYRVNGRFSKIELQKKLVASFLNLIVPDRWISFFIDREAAAIEEYRFIPDDSYMDKILGRSMEIDFRMDPQRSLTEL